MRDKPLPPDMYSKWGSLRWLRFKGDYSHGPEWSAECPNCHDDGHDPEAGEPDRFMIFGPGGQSGKARGKCRRCGHLEWLDDNPQQPKSPQQQVIERQERVDLLRVEEEKYLAKSVWLQKQDFWIQFHNQMTKDQRKLWTNEGIGNWAIDMHRLGYCERKDGTAFSIPYLNSNKEILTVQFRLEDPPNQNDKYRWLSGTRPELGQPWPGEPMNRVILATEGFKKGIVTFQYGPYTYQGEEITVVSVPMKNFPERLLKGFKGAGRVIWLLDPDADTVQKGNKESMLARAVRLSGQDRCRIILLPDKIDDLFAAGLKPSTFQNIISQAEPYIPQRKGNTNGNHSNISSH